MVFFVGGLGGTTEIDRGGRMQGTMHGWLSDTEI